MSICSSDDEVEKRARGLSENVGDISQRGEGITYRCSSKGSVIWSAAMMYGEGSLILERKDFETVHLRVNVGRLRARGI